MDSFIINGEQVNGSSQEIIEIINPATSELVKTFQVASVEDVDYAISSAKSGFNIWKRTPTSTRATIMHKAATLLRENAHSVAKAITLEMGKPIKQALSETNGAADLIDYFAEEGLRVSGDIPKMDLSNELPLIIKDPIGVVAAITPFNYPIALLVWKLGPALITGCSLIAKPDEKSPTPIIMLAEIFLQAGLPGGVFNVVVGDGEVGQYMVEHPDVRKIAFTGSVETGQKVAGVAGSLGKRFTLELGGQCPAIIANDSELSETVSNLINHSFKNSGQYCYRINRVYVQSGIYTEFMSRFIDGTQKLKVGNGISETVDLGPLASEKVLEKTIRHIEDAVSKGGEIVTGGKKITGDNFESGLFFEPTIITNANHDMLLMQEETFGPVIGVCKIESISEGIRLANDSIYGLAAYVFVQDSGLGLQIAREIEAGSVWVNRVKSAYYLCPFGGMKQSGQGREKSKYGLDEYLELKTIYLGLPSIENL